MKLALATFASALLLVQTAAAAAPALAVRAGEDNDRMSVIYSDPQCGSGVRCDVAHMGCRSPGEFFVSALNLPKAEVQAWLKATKGVGSLDVDGHAFPFKADSLDGMHGKTGRVDVAFFGNEATVQVWAALAPARSVTLTLGSRKIALAGPGIPLDLPKLTAACQPKSE